MNPILSLAVYAVLFVGVCLALTVITGKKERKEIKVEHMT